MIVGTPLLLLFGRRRAAARGRETSPAMRMAIGALIVAAPLKIEHGSGSPLRVIALASNQKEIA